MRLKKLIFTLAVMLSGFSATASNEAMIFGSERKVVLSQDTERTIKAISIYLFIFILLRLLCEF